MPRKDILILLAIIISFPFFLIRILHNINIKDFKYSLKMYSEVLESQYNDEMNVAMSDIKKNDEINSLFNKLYDEDISIQSFDTVFKYLYIKTNVTYKAHDINYIDCLHDKCKFEINSEKEKETSKAKIKFLKSKYNSAYKKWYSMYEDLLNKEVSNDSLCHCFFHYRYYKYDNEDWLDFENLLKQYNKDLNNSVNNNQTQKNSYANLKSQNKRRLKNLYHDTFESKLSANESTILKSKKVKYYYNSANFGKLSYEFEQVSFDESKFDDVCEEVFAEQWKANSLRTGSMPYSSCYGSSNYCGGSSCSQIKVKNSSTDVILMVKNNRNRVIRHVYINGNDSFTLNVPNGTYSVYFYNGEGWNPNKKMKNTYCGTPKGGFVSKESVTKDDNLSVYDQIMTYTLYPVSYGNFSPEGSSINEAF